MEQGHGLGPWSQGRDRVGARGRGGTGARTGARAGIKQGQGQELGTGTEAGTEAAGQFLIPSAKTGGLAPGFPENHGEPTASSQPSTTQLKDSRKKSSLSKPNAP